MPIPYRRVALAGVLTAAAVAVPVVALGSGSDVPAAKPTVSSTTLQAKRAKAEAAKPTDSSTTLHAKRAKTEAAKSGAVAQMRALASSAGITESRLGAGL